MTDSKIINGLEVNLCAKLRDLVNSTDMFWKDDIEKRYYNHLCAMMDRIDESMGHIVAHNNIPKTNDELMKLKKYLISIREVIWIVSG